MHFARKRLTRAVPCERPVRPDHARYALERAGDEFAHQQTRPIDRARHIDLPFRDRLETDTTVVGFIADQHHETMSLRSRIAERALEQRAAYPATAKWRLDRQWAEQQRRGVADADRQQP